MKRDDLMKTVKEYMQKENQMALERSYMNAYHEGTFKDYVDSLDMEEALLMKYTSLLEEAAKEHQNCHHCKGLSQCQNQIPGHVYTPKKEKNRILFSYQMCAKKEKEEEKKAYQKKISYFQIPKEIANASFKELYKDSKARLPIVQYFRSFMEDYLAGKKVKGLYLCGSFGSGKTYMIAALFNELAKKDIASCMVYYPELLRDLKSSFHDTYEEKYETVKKAPLLLLDDLGAENNTTWARDEVLGPILQYRMEEDLPTFFTSNFSLEEVEQLLSNTGNMTEKVKAKRIIERIKQLSTVMQLNSKNRRDEN